MPTRSIPKDRWRDELDAFSRDHQGWRIDLCVASANGQMRTEAHDLPLVGISCDAPGSARIAVLAGDRADDHLTHEIGNAISIDVARDARADGAAEQVSIRSADGSETRVDFKPSREIGRGTRRSACRSRPSGVTNGS